jgi:tRNA (mo5U34)-methyltransferase
MTSWVPQAPPPAPAGFSFDKDFPGLPWHQSWELYQGVFTPGRNPVAMIADFAGLPRDLRGLRVLDIGAWHGCFSFECERRGAKEVVALTTEDDTWSGFSRLAQAASSRVVRRVHGTVYRLDPQELGLFDLVLFFGVLYHLRYPLLAIDNIRNICGGTVLIETHTVDHGWLKRRRPHAPFMSLKHVHRKLPGVPLWRYYHDGELMSDASNIFGPNNLAVIEAFASAGFDCRLLYNWEDRSTFEAVARADLATSLQNCYELHASSNVRLFELNRASPPPLANPPRAQLRIPPPPPLWKRALRKLLPRQARQSA